MIKKKRKKGCEMAAHKMMNTKKSLVIHQISYIIRYSCKQYFYSFCTNIEMHITLVPFSLSLYILLFFLYYFAQEFPFDDIFIYYSLFLCLLYIFFGI